MLMQEGHDGSLLNVVGGDEAVPTYGIWGDKNVLRRLIQDPSQAANNDGPPMRSLIGLGDSMMNWTMNGWGTDGIGVPWGRGSESCNGLATSAYAFTVYNAVPGGTAVPTPIGDISTIFPTGTLICTFNGTAVPGGNETVNRILYSGGITPDNLPYQKNQIVGKKITCAVQLWCGPWGTPLNCVFISIRDGAAVVSVYQSAKVNTYQAVPGYKTITVDIPANHNWTPGQTLVPELCVTQGAVPAAGTMVVTSPVIFTIADRGLNFVSQAIGGWQTRFYVQNSAYTEAAFARLAALPGRKTLLIQLGANGTGPAGQTIEQDKASKVEIIRRFRTWEPDGDVIFTTAYRTIGASQGCNPWKRKSDIEIIQNSYNACLVDLYNLMPSYEEMVALGLMSGDGVHLTLAGFLYMQKTLSRAMGTLASTF